MQRNKHQVLLGLLSEKIVCHTTGHWSVSLCRRHVDGLVQERRNSSALAVELSLSCINPSMCGSEWCL